MARGSPSLQPNCVSPSKSLPAPCHEGQPQTHVVMTRVVRSRERMRAVPDSQISSVLASRMHMPCRRTHHVCVGSGMLIMRCATSPRQDWTAFVKEAACLQGR